MKVQQALISKKESSGGPGGRMGGGPGGRGGPHTPGRGAPPQDEGWNTVPISKNRPIDTSRLSKITKVIKLLSVSICRRINTSVIFNQFLKQILFYFFRRLFLTSTISCSPPEVKAHGGAGVRAAVVAAVPNLWILVCLDELLDKKGLVKHI